MVESVRLPECLDVGVQESKVLWIQSKFEVWIIGQIVLMIITEMVDLRIKKV